MIIHQPEKITQETHTIVWAKIELDKKVENFPDYLWFRVPNLYAKYTNTQSDAFLVSGLLGGMYLGEDIQVRGSVSPRLAYHLEEYQFVLNFLYPKEVHLVTIEYEKLEQLPVQPMAVGTTFSGGVDSFFALLKHAPENQPSLEHRITHALFIDGFDIVQKDKQRYQALYKRYKEALESIDIELIPLQTNVVSVIIPRLRFPRFYSPALVGSSMILAGLFKRFIISNSWDYYQLQTQSHGSNPLSDRLFSTESLEIDHFGANYRRVEKVEAISDWKLAQEHLRVCGTPFLDEKSLNCSRCGKCLRTMIPIYAMGKMEQFTTFLKPLRSNRELLLWARKFDPSPAYVPENFDFLRKHKPELLPWLRLTAMLGYTRHTLLQLLPNFFKRWLQPFGYFTDHFKEEQAFDDPEIIKTIESKA